jgi:adenosylmethionine---8-amino-7-oxononanoate aminotransferase
MNNLQHADRKNIWHPFTPLIGSDDPLLIESAEGVFLNTHDGRKIIDAISSWWVNIHGHSNPVIAEAIAIQAKKLEHVIFAGFTHEPAVKLSENLLRILPDNQSKIFFSDNGSTAVEVALKMAFQFWHNQGVEKTKVIALQGAYHGDTFGAMSVGDRGLFTKPFFPFLFDVEFIDFPSPDNHEAILSHFKSIVNSGKVAAFIFEPLIQAAAGMRIYSCDLLDKLISMAQEQNVLCIADEVFTGFGRTGKMFASDYLTNKPDIVAISKGLTGGTLPLGVTSCSEKIVSAFRSGSFDKTFFHGHSFTANPLSCAAANCSIELLLRGDCQSRIQQITEKQKAFSSRMKRHEKLVEARNLGTIIALELKTNASTSYTNEARKKIYNYFLERNILLRPLGNVIYIVPPYVITDQQLDSIYAEIESFLRT